MASTSCWIPVLDGDIEQESMHIQPTDQHRLFKPLHAKSVI